MRNFLNEFEEILYKCERPSRYVGGEFLTYQKDFDKADVKVLLAFPDKYEIGISNFGHKILYHIINSRDNFLADRVYAPDFDFKNLLEKSGKKLYALDTKQSVKKFNIIGFALQYELSYTTILAMLEMADIPVFSKDRKEDDPIIIAGGPCAFNPNPVSEFIDLFLIGDGEEIIIEMCEKYKSIKNLPRDEKIKELAKIEGIYSPKYSKTVKKRVSPLIYENHPVESPIPHFSSIHDRATVEIRRGCARLCRFCQSAHTNLPIRERKKEEIIELVKQYVKNTGYDEYSLLSLSSNDHKDIEEIIENLNSCFKGTGVNVSLPSQRADNFSLKLANLMGDVKKAGITLAPEAGSQKMRDIINKNLTQEQILNAVLAIVGNGWHKIKLYFMIGLPRETYEDLDAILNLLQEIQTSCKNRGFKTPQITCSVSIFVPKPFTPFQWCAQNSLSEIEGKIKYLKSKPVKNVKINIHNPKLSQIEAFLARGDKNLNDFIYKMYKTGAYLESWDENIDFEKYLKIAAESGINIENLTAKTWNIEDILPWDFIDCGLDKNCLKEGYKKAFGV